MPVTPSAPEAIARAVLEKPPVAGAVLTPMQERAKALRQKTAKEGPRSTLDSLRKPVGRSETLSLLDKNFGVDIDPATGKKIRAAGSPEETRFNNSKQRAEIISNYLEKGYDGLTPPEKIFVTNEIKNALSAWPPGQQFIDVLTPAEQQELFEKILKGQEDEDIKLPATVRKLLEERMAQGVIADEVTEKQRKFDELRQKETEIQNQVTLNATELTNVSGSLAQFETVGGTPGAKLRELERLQKKSTKLNQDLEEKTDQLETAKTQLNRLENQRDMLLATGASTTAVDGLIPIKETAISGSKTEISRIQQQLDRKQALETEKASLEARKQTLGEEKARLQQQLQDAIRQRTGAQADFMKAKIERTEKEEKFADSIKNLFSDASINYLMDKIQVMEAADKQVFDEEKAKAVDPAEKALIDAMKGQRWEKDKRVGIGRFGRRTLRVLDGKAIQVDFNTIMTANGDPKEAMRQALQENGITVAEADAKVNDPEFMKKMAPQFMEKLLTRAVEAGVKFTEHDARVIIESEWGAQMIDRAVDNSEALKKALERLGDKGVLEGRFSSWLKDKGGGSILKFLLLLLGGGVLLSGGTAALSAAIFK